MNDKLRREVLDSGFSLTYTTRTYPRTAREAFKGVDYGAAIERPARRYPGGWWALVTLCGLAGLVLSWVTR